MTVEQVAWWVFVGFYLVAFVICGLLGQWTAWGLAVLTSAVYVELRLRWMPW